MHQLTFPPTVYSSVQSAPETARGLCGWGGVHKGRVKEEWSGQKGGLDHVSLHAYRVYFGFYS